MPFDHEEQDHFIRTPERIGNYNIFYLRHNYTFRFLFFHQEAMHIYNHATD